MERAARLRLLYALILVGGLLVLAGGWQAFGPPPANGGDDRYVEGVLGRPQHPHPLLARAESADADLAALLFSGLVRIGPDGTPLPDLAERWEITPDGRAYTFHLRSQLVWHDGERLDAQDVAFTVATVQTAGFQGPSTLAARWAGVSVLAPDERTVVFRLPAPSASFLAQASIGIVPEHLLSGLTPAALLDAPFHRAPVGSGPYRLVRLDARAALLERNPSYHLGAPRLQHIELRFYADEAGLASALASRAVDGALLSETPSEAALRAGRGRGELRSTPLIVDWYLALFVNNQRPPLGDPGLRRALAASIEREALARLAGGVAGDGPIVPGTWAYVAGKWPGPPAADELFDAAGWRRGSDGARRRDGAALKFELVTNADPAREALARAVAEQLRARGVAVELDARPAGELLRERLQPRNFDLLLFAWDQGVDPDPYAGWHTSQIAAGGRNIAGFHDADMDALLESARLTVDVTERQELYAKLTERFVELAPSVFLLYPQRLYVQPRSLEPTPGGVLFEPASRFRDVHRWALGRR